VRQELKGQAQRDEAKQKDVLKNEWLHSGVPDQQGLSALTCDSASQQDSTWFPL
jgi:hypothetical protein